MLVVEDDPATAEALRRGLTAEGYLVELAHDGNDGLWLATESGVDLIVLDVMLPGMNGYRLCRELPRPRRVDADSDADRQGR